MPAILSHLSTGIESIQLKSPTTDRSKGRMPSPSLERIFARPIVDLPKDCDRYAIACTCDGGAFMDGQNCVGKHPLIEDTPGRTSRLRPYCIAIFRLPKMNPLRTGNRGSLTGKWF
jgi:hypothetical protein